MEAISAYQQVTSFDDKQSFIKKFKENLGIDTSVKIASLLKKIIN